MLQQTRVETVLPYFEQFLKRFPTLMALARAPLPSVLKAWAGLGYYARARHLHAAAKIIWHKHGGKIPSTKKELISLPGFGSYTAGAVASLAFNEPVAALDGNGNRIFSRLLDYRDKASANRQKNLFERVAEDLILPGRASDFNQALMDLGALNCLPVRPRCPSCPLKRFCGWRGIHDQKIKQKGKKIRKEAWAVALVEWEGRFLLHRKEGHGLLAGLWQFPTMEVESGEDDVLGRDGMKGQEELKRMLQEKFGLRIKMKGLLPPKEHFFTHLHVKMKPFLYSFVKKIPAGYGLKNVRWVRPSSFTRYPSSAAMHKIAALISSPSPGRH